MQLNLPYADADTEGIVAGEFRARQISGIADARARLSINLKGAPSMERAGLQALVQNPTTIVGASLLLQVPMHPTWLFEIEVGAWLFGNNDQFLGEVRKQDPILSTEMHLIKQIRPGPWASLDANYYVGGRTSTGGAEQRDLQRNSRLGATAVLPIQGRHAARGSYSTGVVTASGGDYDVVSPSYLYAW